MLGFNGGTIGIANTVFTGTDPNYSDVSLLLNGNETNGSTTFTDSSSYSHTVTPVGSAQISTTQSKFGGSSMYFDGSGDYLEIPSSTEFDLGFGAFAVEAWIYLTANGTTASGETYWPIVNKHSIYNTITSTGNNTAWDFRYCPQQGNKLGFFNRIQAGSFAEGVNLFSKYSTAVNLSLNTWYHVAAVRDGTTLKLFLNGQDVTDTNTGNYDWSTIDMSLDTGSIGQNKVRVGRILGGSNPGTVVWYAVGYIDDLRITKGVARYTSNFTPPTAQLPGGETGTFASGLWTSSDHIKQIRNELWPGPSIVTNGLVLHLDAGDSASYPGSGTTWTDLSGNGNNGTLVNGVGYNSANLGSLSFDGGDDYVSIPNMSTYLTNKTQFSYSTFIKITGSQTLGMFFSFGNSSSFPNDITFYYYPATNSLNFQVNNGLDGDGYVLYGIGQYDNICVVYDGNQSTNATRLKVYINGNLQTLTFSYNVPASTSGTAFTDCGIGGYSTSGYSSSTFFAGNVGTSQLYNRALTSSEVTQNFDALKGRYGL